MKDELEHTYTMELSEEEFNALRELISCGFFHMHNCVHTRVPNATDEFATLDNKIWSARDLVLLEDEEKIMYTWDLTNEPILFLETSDGETFQQQYGCVACLQYKFTGIPLQIFKDLDKGTMSMFTCQPVRKNIKAFLEDYSMLTDIEIQSLDEALVLGIAKLNGTKVDFVFTWENCD